MRSRCCGVFHLGRQKWQRDLTRRLSWSSLPPAEKLSVTWDQLVVIWQVIGRLVRGGVAALTDNPHRVAKPLSGQLTGCHGARRGTSRVVYRIDEASRTVQVLDIDRSEIYRPHG